jgi:hypothetical protein
MAFLLPWPLGRGLNDLKRLKTALAKKLNLF